MVFCSEDLISFQDFQVEHMMGETVCAEEGISTTDIVGRLLLLTQVGKAICKVRFHRTPHFKLDGMTMYDHNL